MAWEQWPTGNLGRPRGATQVPPLRYAPVGMTILFGNAQWSFHDGVRTMAHGEFGKAERRNADPSTSLRSGRDDNFVWERSVEFPRWRENNCPTGNMGNPRGATQIPPLRYAPVGMAILFGNAQWSFHDGVRTIAPRGIWGIPGAQRRSLHFATLRSGWQFCLGTLSGVSTMA